MGMISNPSGVVTPATKEFDVKWKSQEVITELGNFPTVARNLNTHAIFFSFFVPNDFTALVDAVLALISNASATHRVNIYSDYGSKGQAYTEHQESDLDVDTVLVANELSEIDISGVLSSLVAGDKVGIGVLGDTVNTWDVSIIGLRIKYT